MEEGISLSHTLNNQKESTEFLPRTGTRLSALQPFSHLFILLNGPKEQTLSFSSF